MATISQEELERLVLDAMQNNLMDQDALSIFCAEYAKERNRLRAEADQGRDTLENELKTVTRDHSKLVDAIIAGIPADQVKDRMQTLDDRRIVPEAKLASTPNADPIRIHPRMAMMYREKVAVLIKQPNEQVGMPEAKEAFRALIGRIVLPPSPATDKLDIHIDGALAGLLSLAFGSKRKMGLTGEDQAFESIDN